MNTRQSSSPTLRAAACLAALSIAASVAQAQASVALPASSDRWVSGSQLKLRAEPSAQAQVLKRLALNTKLRYIARSAEPAFCEVEVAATSTTPALHGHTACRYLATAPLDLKRLGSPTTDDGKPNPSYDPARMFWLQPSWGLLEAYGLHLAGTRLNDAQRADPATPRPPDAEYERMKAHLAKGIYGDAPAPWPTWEGFQKTSADILALPQGQRLIREGMEVGAEMSSSLRLRGQAFDSVDPAGSRRAAALVRSIALPTITPSLFKQSADVAGGMESVEALSGRFHIVVSYQTRPKTRGENDWRDGAWDVGSVSAALTQPLVQTTLYRDGRIKSAPTHAREAYGLWGNTEPPMCEGYVDGFAYGDADPALWRYPGLLDLSPDAPKPPNDGQLLSIVTRTPLPMGERTSVQVQRQTLNRDATGFVRGTLMGFDLNVDGVPDLAVWEGVGHGPGHLEGETTTDDAYQRLFFVNIAGRWLLMGADTFAYGCGC